MICRECKVPVPDGLLACPGCTERRSTKALWRYQLDPLRKIAAGQGGLTTRSVEGVRHVQMFGADRAFCGREVGNRHKRGHFTWGAADLRLICAGCGTELTKCMAEACPAEVSR